MDNKFYSSLDQLPLFLTAADIAAVLSISLGGAYMLLHSKGFPTLHIGRRMVAPRERFLEWLDEQLPS